jgi:glycosyltransferase involved in cell wall biosynthesis
MAPISREFLLDVSRLVWRVWKGRLPTGIDRVCLEYLRHFGPRSQAVVQFRGRIFVLSVADSDALFALLAREREGARRRLMALAPRAWMRARRSPPRAGMIYLNVGHTGLHEAALPRWIASHKLKAVYLIHDLIPITHPQFCREGEAAKHVRRIQNALRSASAIVAISKATLEELTEFAAAQGLAMPPAAVAWIAPGEPCNDLASPRSDRPYFVTLGTIEGRKNHLLLLNCWRRLVAELQDAAAMLVVIGQRGWEAEAAEAVLDHPGELAGHLLELGDCADDEVRAWLKGARALLMPSFAEGFGLPLVEAMECGTPVLASDLPVYREFARDIPTYLRPDDADAWEQAIRAFTGDAPERERQKRELRHYRAPTWSSHFAVVESAVEALQTRR